MNRLLCFCLIFAMSISNGCSTPLNKKDLVMFSAKMKGQESYKKQQPNKNKPSSNELPDSAEKSQSEYEYSNLDYSDPTWGKGDKSKQESYEITNSFNHTTNVKRVNVSASPEVMTVLHDAINKLPGSLREQTLPNLTIVEISESIDFVIKTLLEEFIASECSKIATAELFLETLKKRILMEFSPRISGNLYKTIESWSIGTTNLGEEESPLTKESIIAIVSMLYGPVMKKIEQLDKSYDVLQNVNEFFEMSRPDPALPALVEAKLSEALRVVFSPFGILRVERPAECSAIDVVTDLLHMSHDISNYFQSYVIDNFVTLISSNEPRLSEEAARSLLDYLTENYSMPQPVVQMASISLAPTDEAELRWQCARALSELYFGAFLVDSEEIPPKNVGDAVSSLELADLLEQYHDAMAQAGDQYTSSYMANIMAQYRSKLDKKGVTDLSPLQILTAFCQIFLEESEKNGLNRVELINTMRQTLYRLGNEGISSESRNHKDSAARGYTVDALSGLLDVMRQIVDDISRVLAQTNVTIGLQKRRR